MKLNFFRLNFLRLFRSGCDDVKPVRMGRTMESTIFEIVALFLVIVMWALAIWMYIHAPETIPTHFDLAGHANNEGSRLTLLILAAIGTVLTICLMVGAYVPTLTINSPSKLENIRQYVLASRMIRVIALLTCLLFICCILLICFPTSKTGIPLITFVALIALTPIIFAILIRKARTR